MAENNAVVSIRVRLPKDRHNRDGLDLEYKMELTNHELDLLRYLEMDPMIEKMLRLEPDQGLYELHRHEEMRRRSINVLEGIAGKVSNEIAYAVGKYYREHN